MSKISAEQEAPREIELKLEVASGETGPLLGHPLIAQAEPLPAEGGHLRAVYFDTPDQALRRAGLSLRIRRKNGRHIQTVKAAGGPRGLSHDRGEWEHPVDGELDFDAALGTPLAPFLSGEAGREKIRPAFTVETDRQAFAIRRNGAVVELAIDQARASAGNRTELFSEVELELKKGAPSVLFSIARDLADIVPLRLSPLTKSERGYSLVDSAIAEPASADEINLPRHASCGEAFQIVARSCLYQVVWNEALFRRRQHPEALHQMRVGFRRLGTALSLFKAMLAHPESGAVKAELRWAGKQLGPARDLDVLLEALREPDGGGTDVSQRIEEAERRRAEAYEALLETLSTPRFMRAILNTAIWIEAGEWLTQDEPEARAARERPHGDHAAAELSRRWKRIRKRAKRIAALEPDERHALRIRIKRLRYGSEFFHALFRNGPAKKRHRSWLALLKRLQDTLGEMNDLHVGASLLSSETGHAPDDARRRQRKLLAQAGDAARKLRKAEPFWT